MNYYIADLHIGHANVIKFDSRPFPDVAAMNSAIIENWNRRVKTTDTVYILGDFIWAKESEWPFYAGPLAGKKVLIRGNHDPAQFSDTTAALFREITDYKEITDGGRHVILCHYAIPFYRNDFSAGMTMLYGHVHVTKEYEYLKELRKSVTEAGGENVPKCNFINVGAMMPYMDYTPRTLDEIIAGDLAYRSSEDYVKCNI